MKYFCKNCKTEIITDAITDLLYNECPICHHGARQVVEIPVYETVAQWEKRKREKYPDTAPVYCYYCDYGDGEEHWHCSTKDNWNASSMTLVVATEAGAPPDDWRPE